jgi:glutamate-ammonia-ligase adenylyltransferase
MPGTYKDHSLSSLARYGFSRLESATAALAELSSLTGIPASRLVENSVSADPDSALSGMLAIARRDVDAIRGLLARPTSRARLWRVFGASQGLADYFLRRPEELDVLAKKAKLPSLRTMQARFLAAVDAEDGFAKVADDSAVYRLRVAYRRVLAEIASVDLEHPEPATYVREVTEALSDAAGAALEASLAIARAAVAKTKGQEAVAATRIAIIGMGKSGARELNYVSDVDVIFVGGSSDEAVVSEALAIDIATRLARETIAGLSAAGVEPQLWEVDAALRPEGKSGALVRTLESHLAYYERWANSWEFQALLKARPIAGDAALGAAYVEAIAPLVWGSAGREDFVESVQRMRQRVTEHIDAADAPYQIKLGEGGLRDIEFAVQLLQLVHGLSDPALRTRATLESLDALAQGGYIGRADAASFAQNYAVLRLLEHRLQLQTLTRTHLMPSSPPALRTLARATGLAVSGEKLWELWEQTRRSVRTLHTRLFYQPMLTAVAGLSEQERSLSSEHARDRLAAIGFRDPARALGHIQALTSGISRKVMIQRNLMPVMVRWFAAGIDPDYGLSTFRRISERLGDTSWFLRVLRDSAGAAEQLTTLLATSRYIGELMEWIPESVAWLDNRESLRPRGQAALTEEAEAILKRYETADDALRAVRALRRREVLRTAMGAVLGRIAVEEMASALTDSNEVAIRAALKAVRRGAEHADTPEFDFAIIAMGRFGGAELGFGSDADVLFVVDAPGEVSESVQRSATKLVSELRQQVSDARAPLELDADLRPEGRNGPLVRSLDAYAEYYRRWSLSWEAQALLRARGIAGDAALLTRFTQLADTVRYPENLSVNDITEIKRIKARMEGERLPQGADPRRHLKLGPGTLSDVEWLVQLLQLQHAHRVPELQTTSTLGALDAAVAASLVTEKDAALLREAWLLSSRLRSAITVLTGGASDMLPTDRRVLDGIGRVLDFPPNSATAVDEHYLAVTRRARRVFERLFYG